MTDRSPLVVVGAGLGAARLVTALAGLGYGGRVVMVGSEAHAPYDRPPLSKEFLGGRCDERSLALLDDLDVDLELCLGDRATRLDVPGRHVELASGRTVRFDQLVLATGSRPRRPSWWRDLTGLHELHTLDQASALRCGLGQARSLLVVGAGFVGLEVAATASALGLEVTVVEAAPMVLPGKVGARLAGAVRDLHDRRGVRILDGVGVLGVTGEDRFTGLRLADGQWLAGEIGVVAVGAVPNTDWLGQAVATERGGVLVDSHGETSEHGIFALGDIAGWAEGDGGHRRIEHWTSAGQQAEVVASNLVASRSRSIAPVPYFWSDQHGVRIQVMGAARPEAEEIVGRHSTRPERWCVLYRVDGLLVGFGTVGWPLAYVRLAGVLAAGGSWIRVMDAAAALGLVWEDRRRVEPAGA